MRVPPNSKNAIFANSRRYLSSFVKLINVTWKYKKKSGEKSTKDRTKENKSENYTNDSEENSCVRVNSLTIDAIVEQDQMRRDESPLFVVPNIEVDKCKTIVVFYAKDHPNSGDLHNQLSTRQSPIMRRLFRLVLINVEEPRQIGSVLGLLTLSDNDESIGGVRSQLSLLFCFLISAKVTSLIMDDTSHLQRCLLLCSTTSDTIHRDTDSAIKPDHIITYAFYDEANEINMFRIKYKLTQCTYILINQVDQTPSIITTAIRLCNEILCQHQQEDAFSYCNFTRMLSNKRPLFKVFPKTLTEGNGKVWVIFDASIEPDRHQIDVLLNSQSTLASLKLKWKKSQILQTTIPDKLLMECTTVQLAVVADCALYLGTRYIKCEPKQTDFSKLLLKATSAELLCQSFGVSTIDELDRKMADAFDESLPDFGIYRYVLPPEHALATEYLPTWLHFAAQYRLEQLMCHLLHSPTAIRSCFVLNSSGFTPLDVARHRGHSTIVQILKSYMANIELIQQDMILNSAIRPDSRIDDGTTHDLTTNETIFNQPYYKPGSSLTCLNSVAQAEKSTDRQLSVGNMNSSLDGNNIQIMAAKEELLCIIDQFSCGMPIDLFERLFSHWEDTYSDVLQGQMSDQLLHSLNEIKKLCLTNEDNGGNCVENKYKQLTPPKDDSPTLMLKCQPHQVKPHCHNCDVAPIRRGNDVTKQEEKQINFEEGMDMQYHCIPSRHPGRSGARSTLSTVKSDSGKRCKPSGMQRQSDSPKRASTLVNEVEPPINRSVHEEVFATKTRHHSHVEHDQYQRDNQIITLPSQDISRPRPPSGREAIPKVTSSTVQSCPTAQLIPCQKIYASGSNYYLVPRPFPLSP